MVGTAYLKAAGNFKKFKLENNKPKTFPVNVNFYWLENTGQSFETDRTELIDKKVILIKGNGVILGKRLFAQTTYNKLNLDKELKGFVKKIGQTKFICQSNVFILIDIWSTGPYHFYIDMLSKLIEVKEGFNIDLNKITVLIYDDFFTNTVVIPLFRDLNLENLRIIKLKRNEQYVLLGRNYFVTKPHIMGSNNSRVIPLVYDLIRANLAKYTKINYSNYYKGIYYYRTGRYRKVVNDTEIIKELKILGFFCTNFDDLSYIEAFQLMQQTKLFVGIHGGGMTNMLFLPPDSAVIEIKNDNPNPISHCYWHLARSLNFDYTMFVAETVGDNNIVEGKGCDLRVDTVKLIELINVIGTKKS